jgi:O-glycosyl hydrolase
VTVTVDKATQYQRIDGFGGFGAKLPWWSNAPFYDQAFVDRLIDDLGITVIRDEIPTDFEITNDNNDPFVTDLSKFNLNVEYRSDSCKSQSAPLGQHFDYLIALKNKAAAQGSELKMIASTWSPPYWMKYTKCIFGLDATWNRLVMREILSGENPNDLRDEYAEMLVAYVKTVKQATGIDIYAISVQNEPAFPEPYQSAVYSPAQLAETIRVVGERFEEEGLETKIFMPEDVTDYARVSGFVTAAMDSEARQYVDIMAAHGYGPDGATADGTNAEGWTQFQSLAGRYNLPLWMTETSGYQNNTAGSIQLAQAMLGGLKHGKLNAWVWWALSDVSVSNFGLMDKGTPTSLYYASKQFYRYIRPGAIHVAASATDAKTQVIAFAHPTTKQLTIVAINGESTAKSVSLDINGGSVPTSFEVIRTSASEQAKSLGTVAASEAILLPANSITTLVGTAPAADAPVAPKISSQPQSVAVNEGAVATFRVEANGTPDLSYQWYRNGVAMAGANGTSYTLTATAADNGAKFTVKVSSAHGNVTSSAATLTVNAFTGMSIVKTAQAPAIDGSIDAGWASAQGVDMSKVVMDIWPPSEIDNAADFDGSAKLLWDNQNLYLLYQITDQTVTITDSVELILDIDNSKDTAYGANDFQFAFGSNGTATEYKHNATTGVTAVSKPVQGGYVVEAKIPWATVGGTLAQGALIGLDVNANDIDVTNREAKIAWFSASNEIWHDPSLAGVGKLVGGTNTPTATPTDAPTSTPTTAPTSTPTTAPTSTPTTAPTSTPTNTAVPTSTPVPLAVKPVLECVVKDKDNKYLARFSYTNPNDYTITIPVGPRNKFAPSPENRGQPTTFVAGQQQGVFEVPMVKEVTWTLDGTSVTASKDMKQLCK